MELRRDRAVHPQLRERLGRDIEHKLALVEIAYNGTDMCWEPSAQHHVISW